MWAKRDSSLCNWYTSHIAVLSFSLLIILYASTTQLLSSGGIKNDEKLIKDQGFCQTGKLNYTIVLNYGCECVRT